ncbi:MAG TPA: ATP-binding protein [Solirubrobacteraceae bacterium]|nr:ATP-binding protein [Solirubrobacteraceae bacterium]
MSASPLSYLYGNCVFARGLDDGWAAFSVRSESYAWLSEEGKRMRFAALTAALEAVGADVQVARVARGHRLGPAGLLAAPGRRDRTPHARSLLRYRKSHEARLGALAPSTPAVFLFVSLREPERDVASYLSAAATSSPREWLCALRGALTRDRRVLSIGALERARVRADRVHARLADYLPVRPVRGVELQWLVRRAFARGLGEPDVEDLHAPPALLFERNGEAVLTPLEADVMRWAEGTVKETRRALQIDSELGRSWQAMLVMGALPDRDQFPGAHAEWMFRPPERLDFGVDVALCARYLPNGLALRIARRRIQDADQIARAESDGDQGVTDLGIERTEEARDLVAYLQASNRPPLLRTTISLAVAARDEDELERRVELCRRAYGEVRLYRPPGDQLELFLQQLPAQRSRVSGYDAILTSEQVAAMMPTATHAAGSDRGFYLGHSLSGSRQPMLFDLRDGSANDRNTTILSVGALGSGKTTLAQKLLYEAFLLGARVIDCDPKGDHAFHRLDEVAPHVECVTLRPDPALRGLLDPLRVAPSHLRQDAAVSFLRDLLPGRADAAWETAVLAAVDRVVSRSAQPSCGDVVDALVQGDPVEMQVGETLAIYSRSGLTQLGFADARTAPPALGERQVTYLPIRDLPAPDPSVPRADYSQAERVGEQIVRLIAMFAAHLMSVERSRLKVFSFDEGWRLLADPVGRTLLMHLQRMGRSELAVPIISTQLVTDAVVGERESLANLIGSTFVFGMRSDSEAGRALSLLGLDGSDPHLRRVLLEMEAGRCLFRDHRGRVEAIQVEVVVPEILRAFSTTPPRT